MSQIIYGGECYHHGILGQKWGVRRYQNEDGSLTPLGARMVAMNRKPETVKGKVLAGVYAGTGSERAGNALIVENQKNTDLWNRMKESSDVEPTSHKAKQQWREYDKSVKRGEKLYNEGHSAMTLGMSGLAKAGVMALGATALRKTLANKGKYKTGAKLTISMISAGAQVWNALSTSQRVYDLHQRNSEENIRNGYYTRNDYDDED